MFFANHASGTVSQNYYENAPPSAELLQLVGNLAAAVTQVLPVLGLSSNDEEKTRRLVAELRRESAAGMDRTRVRTIIETLKSVAIGGSGEAVGAAIVALASQAQQHL